MREFPSSIDANACQVFLFRCPASMPFGFASHHWFVINDHGTLSRYEVLHRKVKGVTRWGYLHKDCFRPSEGIEVVPHIRQLLWSGTLVGKVEGDIAERMAAAITRTPETYPYRERYVLTGPNSNTYVQWILKQFPEAGFSLPRNAFGWDYDVKAPRSPSRA